MGTDDVYHLSFVKDNVVLVLCRVTKSHPFLVAHRLHFLDRVLEEVRLMTATTFVGGREYFAWHRLLPWSASALNWASDVHGGA